MNPIKDQYGIKLKFPNRSCKTCKRYPCFNGINKCISDFAKYGCKYYSEINKKNKNETI